MKLTFLGSGTSQGVPVIGCRCEVCTSKDRRDNRLRTSALIEVDDCRMVIDTGPDFRAQMLSCGVRNIDAVLLTHEHRDHIAGLDDIRAFNFVDYPPTVHVIDIYASQHTAAAVREQFYYAFERDRYKGVPQMELHTIEANTPFFVKGVEVEAVKGKHSERFTVFGYRVGALAYLTDFKSITDEQIERLKGVEVIVVNALRFTEHHSHFSVADALALIAKVKPRRAFLTHASHEIGLHAELEQQLPDGVFMAYDGLQIEI